MTVTFNLLSMDANDCWLGIIWIMVASNGHKLWVMKDSSIIVDPSKLIYFSLNKILFGDCTFTPVWAFVYSKYDYIIEIKKILLPKEHLNRWYYTPLKEEVFLSKKCFKIRFQNIFEEKISFQSNLHLLDVEFLLRRSWNLTLDL